MPKAATGKIFPVLPEGDYNAVLGVILEKKHVLVPKAVDKATGGPVYKDKLTFVYVVDAKQPDGAPFELVQFFWNSQLTHKKSKMGPVVQRLLAGTGVKMTDGMELNDLIGTQVKVKVVHSEPNAEGKIYANIDYLQRDPKGSVAIPTGWADAKLKQGKGNEAVSDAGADDDAKVGW